MQQDETLKVFEKMFATIGPKWERFVLRVRKAADREDHSVIFIDDFSKVLERYKIVLTPEDKQKLLLVFPARNEGDRQAVNVGRLYD